MLKVRQQYYNSMQVQPLEKSHADIRCRVCGIDRVSSLSPYLLYPKISDKSSTRRSDYILFNLQICKREDPVYNILKTVHLYIHGILELERIE